MIYECNVLKKGKRIMVWDMNVIEMIVYTGGTYLLL